MNKYIIVAAITIVLLYFGFKKISKKNVKETEIKVLKKMKPTEDQIKTAFKQLSKVYSKEILQNVERIYRLETANFSSGGFLYTFGAGMEVGGGNRKFPYGWYSLQSFWEKNTHIAPITTFAMNENQTGKKKVFLVFPSLLAGMNTLAQLLTIRHNDAASWYATVEPEKSLYKKKLDGFVTRYV